MGVDPEIDDVMARRPRPLTERIIDKHMWTGILSIGLVMGVITLLTIDIFLPGGFVAGSDSLEVARTAGFTTLVFAQLFNAFNSRSEITSAFWSTSGSGVPCCWPLRCRSRLWRCRFCKRRSVRRHWASPTGEWRWPWPPWCSGSMSFESSSGGCGTDMEAPPDAERFTCSPLMADSQDGLGTSSGFGRRHRVTQRPPVEVLPQVPRPRRPVD